MKTQNVKLKRLSLLALTLSVSATMLPSLAAPLAHKTRNAGEDCNNQLIDGGAASNVRRMLAEHERRTNKTPAAKKVEQLQFEEVDGRDVYNMTNPFKTKIKGQEVMIIAGRVEPRANHDSEVWFFAERSPGVWVPVEKMFSLSETEKAGMKLGKRKVRGEQINGMEDPFYAIVDGELILGGVETFKINEQGHLGYRTIFYRDNGNGLLHLQRFTEGPRGMKDIRLAQLPDKSIVVITRPQDQAVENGGRGKNAILFLQNINDLTADNIKKARLIHNQTGSKEWIGSNQIFPLENGDIGFLSHVAMFKDEQSKERGYYVTVYTLENPEPRILLIRTDLGEADDELIAKRPDLVDVLFSGGLVRNGDGTAWLYIGVGDALAFRVLIADPFWSIHSKF